MRKYIVKLYPNVNSFEIEVEADSIDEAINEAEEIAQRNCCFIATPSDVEEA